MDTSQLFTNPPSSTFEAIAAVITIFRAQWQPLMLLVLGQIGAFLIVGAILLAIVFGFFAAYIAAIMAATSQITSNIGAGRHLIDYSFVSGTSRLLQQNNPSYYSFDDDLVLPDMDATLVFVVMFIFVLFFISISLINSLFGGAYIHTLAEAYVGNLPSFTNSIRHGRKKMWSVFCFVILFSLAVAAIIIIPLAILLLIKFNPFLVFLTILAVLIGVVIFSSLMIGAVPSIVIENKTSTQAFQRSYDLCKSYIGFIFCTVFCYQILLMVVATLVNLILDSLPDFVSIVGHLMVQLILSAISPIMNFVLYMSVRVQSENTTKEDLSSDIGCEIVSGVEMAENGEGKLNSKSGSYSNVLTAEVI